MPALRRMFFRTAAPLIGIAAALLCAAPAQALPTPADMADVPARTALSYEHLPTGTYVGSAEDNAPRPGLSTVKLYIADYVVRFGDGSARDRDLARRLIEVSDDGVASVLDSKYPQAISATASEFGLNSTSRGSFWGNSSTSTADTVRFLSAKKRTDPTSPVLAWMNSAAPVAADGTVQDWGTQRLPGVTGSKWGWADDGYSVVASASIGDDFVVASNTYGPRRAQTDDVLAALGDVDLTAPPAPGAVTDLPVIPGLPSVEELLQMLAPR
ncbi:putative uncharacterized protein [Rhodococcus sp. AW25M09]|uniref:hypothetical protein n=1 Tax=Rhodococcus sp. AW25M09 TaxID=1268303 RepID=UPI0002ACC0F4|nr:hypothetical protein [Rhodococcus sp. AW25M09]CCQ15733.1 putative uncharacterized protein [Rhodococcus sp. AW25M09]